MLSKSMNSRMPVPEFGCTKVICMLSSSMNSCMLMPVSTVICPAGRASCTSGLGALPSMLVAAAVCSVRLGRGDVGRRTFGGPNMGLRFGAFCMFGPTSCTVGSGAMAVAVAAA